MGGKENKRASSARARGMTRATAVCACVALACAALSAGVSSASARALDVGNRATRDDTRVDDGRRRRLLASAGGASPPASSTPFADWVSGIDGLDTPWLNALVDIVQQQDSLFGPTTIYERITNRVATYVFSNILRLNISASAMDLNILGSTQRRAQTLQPTTWNSTFMRSIFAEVNDPDAVFGIDALNITKFALDNVCNSDLLRANLNATLLDDAYWQASPLSAEVPSGCMKGCILGSGSYEAIARTYGIRRSFQFNSWRGKCFDELDPSKASNLIKLNYGAVINRVFGLQEPIELYPGTASIGSSNFNAGTRALVVDYSDQTHEFEYFRDELRFIYPGVALGKMYAMPGTSMFGGVLQVPIGAAPVFTVNFLLVGEPQTAMPISP